ncbi:3-isopropylmalate dehydratase large subunit [Nitrospinota bacterium]
MSTPKTLFDKIWDDHVVTDLGDGFALIFVDRHVVTELSSVQFDRLKERKLPLKYPQYTFAVSDHSVPTLCATPVTPEERQTQFTRKMREAAREFGVTHFDVDSPDQGISNIITAELGIALPGSTLACIDSHVCTAGALGVVSWAFGTGEILHILATQTSILRRPPTIKINLEGGLGNAITAKDVVLYLIGQIGVSGGLGCAVEFAGSVIRDMPMEGRLTICNMAVEIGARFALIAPDDITIEYLRGRRFAPDGEAWDGAVAEWQSLKSDENARYDREMTVDVTGISPQVTWGTSPQDVMGIDGKIPDPDREPDEQKRASIESALRYTGLAGGSLVEGTPIDWVFIGSCNNNRISDLRLAASVAKGRKVASKVTAWIVPGSRTVKAQAEAEGLHKIFTEAGFKWGEPGCSMCGGQGNEFTEILAPGVRAVSTINRNFPGRQGRGSITHLVSPAMAAAAAVTGRISDVRKLGS